MRQFLFLLVLLSLSTINLQAQNDGFIGDRWWYGASGQLGGGSSNQQSAFVIGLAPMAGYRILPILSVGPRVSLSLRHDRFRPFGGTLYKGNTWEYHVGAFGRLKPFEFIPIFAQIEGGFESRVNGDLTIDQDNNLVAAKNNGFNARFGLGYSMNRGGRGGFGSEVMLLYDFNLIGINRVDLFPFDFRIGFTLYY